MLATAVFSSGIYVSGHIDQLNSVESANTSYLSRIVHADDKKDSSSDSGSSKKNPTSLSDAELEKPENYPYWLQYWGPWAQSYGGKGSGGEKYGPPGYANVGCVVTTTAIQAARSGVKKNQSGAAFNPGAMTKDPLALNLYKFTDTDGKQGTITRGAWPGGGSLSASQALEECKKIASAGNYPEIRVNGGEHTVAYWKAGDGKPLVYDPSRGFYGDTVKNYSWVTAIEMKGAGIKKFSEDSPGPDGGSDGSTSSDSDSSTSKGGSSGSKDTIKPIFNPFKTPTVKTLPADANDDANNPFDNKAMLAIQDGIAPTLLTWFRVFVTFLIYAYIALGIFGVLMKLADGYLGGIISAGVSRSGSMKDFISPGGELFGISGNNANEIVKSFLIKYGIISSVLMLVASGSLSKLVALIIGAFARIPTGLS